MGGGGVEGTFEGFRRVFGVFHVVGKHHELGDVDELAELRVFEAAVDAVPLGEDAVAIVGFLHLHEEERHAIDQERDVRTELIIAVSVGEFGDDVESVVVKIFEVDEADPIGAEESLVEGLAEVFVVEEEGDFLKRAMDFVVGRGRVDAGEALLRGITRCFVVVGFLGNGGRVLCPAGSTVREV